MPSSGGSVVRSEWVRCGNPACDHVQPVVVPVSAYSIETMEWLGTRDAMPTGPTLRDIMSSGAEKLRPRRSASSRWARVLGTLRRHLSWLIGKRS